MRRSTRLGSVTLVAAAALLACTISADAATITTVKGSAGKLEASMIPGTHHPKINVNWPLKVTATLGGKPAHATAVYEFLFAGTVVSTQYPRNNKHFSFTGHFSDNLVFPGASEGESLTLRVVIGAGGRKVNLDWAITSVS